LYRSSCMSCAVVAAFMIFCVLTHTVAHAKEGSLPSRSQWRATSSAVENPALASSLAIDGNIKTRWGGPFAAGHWFQLDLGDEASIGGVVIRWDSGFAASYEIQSSTNGKQWRTAFETTDSPGDIEYVFFPTIKARYLRLASKPRTADWMASMFEFEPVVASAVPRIQGISPATSSASIWTNGPMRTISGKGANAETREMRIQLPQSLAIAGLQVFWGAPRASARLEGRGVDGDWQLLSEDPESLGETSFLASREARPLSELRMSVTAFGRVPAIKRLRLLSPSRVMTPLKRYEITASRAHRELYPDSLHRQQVYWTATGVPAGVQKSVFDEYGNIEAFKGAPLVQPLWRDDSGRAVAAPTAQRTHSLREGWMPLPAVEWSPQSDLQLRSEAFTIERDGLPVTLTRYRVHNTGQRRQQGRLSLLVRPLQVNPQWQHGGVASIRDIVIEGPNERTTVAINGRVLLHSLSPVDARGAANFGAYGETEITKNVAAGTVPKALTAQDADGLAAALLVYRIELEPGARRDVVIAFPLDKQHVDMTARRLPPSPKLDRSGLLASHPDAGAAFDALASQVAQRWQARVGQIQLSLPDRSLVDMLRAQVAYMLINQTGPAMQPGPRNYNRSFIRDGSATAAVLARMGMSKVARDYLKWYSDHAVHPNGLVSPILNEDGTVNRGFGSDLEHDSQGQFIWLVAEIARVAGGPESVREYAPKVRLALRFLEELRNRTLVPEYASDREAPARFRGLIAPSISHEGYSVPTHSYWDDYFALKGWHDAAWLADGWGDTKLASYARKQYELLRESTRESIEATMAWKQIEFVPASADLADWDPTSVSIALDPAGQMDLLPPAALRYTFDRYLKEIRSRDAPDALYAYTPYEMRNVLTYVHLNQPQEANEVLMNLFRHRRPAAWHVLAEVVHSRERHDGYLGDMPHTWIGSEYVRAVFGMLMREGDDRLHLIPGAPPSWLEGPGLQVGKLPTAYGPLSMSAKQEGTTLRVKLDPGLRKTTKLQVAWPSRQRPSSVTIEGKTQTDYTADGIEIAQPFRELVAQW
jgi:F5/8 type C domain